MTDKVDSNPQIRIDVSDSYFNEKSYLHNDDYYKDLDDRINNKMAEGMKKLAGMVVGRFDSLFIDKIKLLVTHEVEEMEARLT